MSTQGLGFELHVAPAPDSMGCILYRVPALGLALPMASVWDQIKLPPSILDSVPAASAPFVWVMHHMMPTPDCFGWVLCTVQSQTSWSRYWIWHTGGVCGPDLACRASPMHLSNLWTGPILLIQSVRPNEFDSPVFNASALPDSTEDL